MFPNIGIVALAALIPMIIGFIYYNPKLVGTAWMKASGMTEEKMKQGNMAAIYGLCLFLSFLMGGFLFGFVVHQTDVYSMMANEPGFMEEGSAVMNELADLMAKYGDRFRTFGHGAFHGVLISLLFVLPIMATSAMFERRGGKYIFINAGYWTITLALMGGVLCQWG